jgi:DNA-binding beta-propeller fold protein YncE
MTFRNLTILGICCTLGLVVCVGLTTLSSAQDEKKSNEEAATDSSGKASKKPDEKQKAGDDDEVAVKAAGDAPANPFPKKFPAPGLEGGKDWLNTSGEITLKELRGKIVLLDFWTYCCINCMHVLPDLAYLEKKYPNEIAVIGVHSAKFDNEKLTDNIKGAILRYEIKHPVVNDANMAIWRKFQVHSWPTLVVIDPEGNYCGYVAGEGNRKPLEEVIDLLIAYHKAKGTLDQTPLHFNLESQKAGKSAQTPLRFPGKILADEASNRLFISDSNHNRIVITDLGGKVLDVIGSGAIGNKDGGFADAQFDHPQGMDLQQETLYVADTENHTIRAVDLAAKQVKTIAGTGEQDRARNQGGAPLKTALSSPWDLKKIDNRLFIAMAGPHQIWVLDEDSVRPFAGSGREDVLNGPHSESALAQPSGMATDGTNLYVVDSEGSSVRQIPLDPNGEVTTIVGTSDLAQGRCLFEFGDIDGVGDKVRLQHPLGIAYRAGKLYVADTYNHKIKIVDIAKKTAKTFLGGEKAGAKNEPAEFSEPAGLTFVGEKLYIADTNNHLIRVVDLKTNKVSTLELKGLEAPKSTAAGATAGDPKFKDVKPQVVASGEHLQFDVTLQIPAGFKINPEQDPKFKLTAEVDQPLVAKDQLNQGEEIKAEEGKVAIKVPLAAKTGAGKFKLSLTYTFCKDGKGGVCRQKSVSWMIPVTVEAGAEQKSITLTIE